VIGANEGAAEAITNKVGSEITDTVLKTADGSDFKGVHDCQLEDLLNAVMQGADQPSTTDILEQFLDIIAFTFNFQKKVGPTWNFCKRRWDPCNLMASPSMRPNSPLSSLPKSRQQQAKISDENSVPHFKRSATNYPYNHVHTAASLQAMLTKLAGADAV
jgi:hypothetical protein